MPDPPKLNIYGTYRMNRSDNFELTCRGHHFLRWTTPPTSSRFSTSDCSGSGLFCTTLTITNATVNETGQYQCSYRDLKVEDGKTSVSAFISDYKVPFVPSEKEYEVVFIREGERVVIPCRGSVEDLNVTLNTKYPIKELRPDGKDSLWDARTGFTVPSHLISYAGVVSCQTQIGNETFRSPLYIVAVVGYKIYDLTLTPMQERLSVGERLILSCTAHTELNVGIEFNWTHSSGALVSPQCFLLCLEMISLSNTLTVENVTLDHTGEFTCTASSGQMDKSASAYLKVYGGCKETTILLKNGKNLKDDYRIKQKSDALIIRGVTEMDAGNYTVVLINRKTKEVQRRSFRLLVNGLYASCLHTSLRRKWHMSSLKIQKAEAHALYRCTAANKVGKDSRVIFFHVTRGLEVSMSPSNQPLEEDHVVLQCKADRLIYGNLAWFRVTNTSESEHVASVQPCRSVALEQRPLSQVVHSTLQGTNVTLELSLPNASRHDEGLYACQVENIKTGERTCLLHLEAARILNNFTDQKVNVSATITLLCEASGTPNPTVIWTKNNHSVVEGSGGICVILGRHNRTLTIQRVKGEDRGQYTCTACNTRGCDTAQVNLTTEGAEEKTNVELIVPIGSVVIAMFFWLLIVFVIRGRKRPNGGDLKTGYLSMILDSEDMPMDEQCERLTYDANKWEFPRDRLKLGDPLGRGAFGQVVEAAAFGIEKATTCTTVAVKMLKEGATTSEYRALMSELKILIHIGHHLNVVNLLGACTKPGGPLMVIVEYCKHGNLSSYLKSKRGEYSPYKVNDGQRWTRAEEDVTEGDLGLGKIAQLDICTGTAVCSSAGDAASGSTVEMQQESSDYDHLTMEDLISYSFQVAKGMEFLSSRKCIHRDLAARNILLSENNVVKICDFGLARDVYKDPDYVRKGDARLPLKWMAPETIFDRVYTTQSDVWSFGVLLWEIFSLGASPYPGVCIDESFCRRLREGTRMRPPEYATTEIYQTMLDCWLDRPTDRPTFADLVEHLGNLLQASAQQDGKDYIPLTAVEAEVSPMAPEPRSLYNRPQSGVNMEAQLHYDSPSSLGLSQQQSERYSRPLSVKTFEDIPLVQSSVMVRICTEGHTDSGMGFSQEEVKSLNQHLPTTPNFSKESLESESSNQTSGYQSGYHSDDTDTPIYANEEMIMKHNMLSKPPLPKTPEKFSLEIRYSTPPV
uniref:receptor protein-tyrosine kinase n=1 Tax=Salarias fasciatus TaxID=181472 RepID=A0A672IRE5_SALFA